MRKIVRVISGEAGGLKLKTLKGRETRPTSDMVKGGLFNMISPYTKDTRFLDLFCGTGSLGIEALSRGAKSSYFVDSSSASIAVVKENLAHTKLSEKAFVIQSDVFNAINKLSHNAEIFDIIFLDPPYNAGFEGDVLIRLSESGIIRDDGMVIIETDYTSRLPEKAGRLIWEKDRRYGRTLLSFYRG